MLTGRTYLGLVAKQCLPRRHLKRASAALDTGAPAVGGLRVQPGVLWRSVQRGTEAYRRRHLVLLYLAVPHVVRDPEYVPARAGHTDGASGGCGEGGVVLRSLDLRVADSFVRQAVNLVVLQVVLHELLELR